MYALPRNAVLKRKTCVEVTGCTNDFVNFVLVSNPGSHGSKGALVLPDVRGKHFTPLKVMYGHLLSLRTY